MAMLKLVVTQPGSPERAFVVEGSAVTVGRGQACDVVIDQPFVSKQHLRILRGTVVVDLGSSNGTFVGGERVQGAVLLERGPISIGHGELSLSVEDEAEADTRPSPAAAAELAELREREQRAQAELASLRRAEVPRDARKYAEQIARLKGENASLRERVDSLKREMETREEDDGGSVQARLAMQRVESVQELNDALQREVESLRARLAERAREAQEQAPAEAAEDASAELAEARAALATAEAELETQRALVRHQGEQAELVRRLRAELEELREAAPAEADEELRRELEEAREEAQAERARAAELEGRLAEQPAATPERNASDLFFKLQSENAELRRRVAAQEKAAAEAAPAGGRDVRQVKELMEARMRIAALEAELAKGGGARPTAPAAEPRRAAPAPAQPAAPAAPVAAGGCDARAVFRRIAEQDVEGLKRVSGAPVEEFLLVETLRLLRHVERVVTRVAGDLIQLFQLQTMLPDTSGSFRDIVGDCLSDPGRETARRQLVEYFETLGRWLVAALGAHRKAAVLFAAKIKDDLSEKSLVAREPLPPYARVPMMAGNELWRRVQTYLAALSPDAIDEGVEKLAREQAQRLLSERA